VPSQRDNVFENAKWPGSACQVGNQSKLTCCRKNPVDLANEQVDVRPLDQMLKHVSCRLRYERRIFGPELLVKTKHTL
jgi:hypothetical protein